MQEIPEVEQPPTSDMNYTEWQEKVKESNFKDIPGFGKTPEGSISLQDNNEGLSFRNIKIKSLDPGNGIQIN